MDDMNGLRLANPRPAVKVIYTIPYSCIFRSAKGYQGNKNWLAALPWFTSLRRCFDGLVDEVYHENLTDNVIFNPGKR